MGDFETGQSLKVLALSYFTSGVEELDLRSVLMHPGNLRFQTTLQKLRRLTLLWQNSDETVARLTPFETLCPAAQLEQITLIGIPWSVTADWLKQCDWTLTNLRVLRLSSCPDDGALRTLLSRSPLLHEFCILHASESFFESFSSLLRDKPMLQKVTLGNLPRRDSFGPEGPAPPCSLPIDLALHPVFLDLKDYRVSIAAIPNNRSRNSLCMRLLRLRINRPSAIFEVTRDRSHVADDCQVSLRVHVDRAPIFARCTQLLSLQERRPKIEGKHIFGMEYDEFLHPWDHHWRWDTLPEDVQDAYNGVIAHAYNQRLRCFFDPNKSDDQTE